MVYAKQIAKKALSVFSILAVIMLLALSKAGTTQACTVGSCGVSSNQGTATLSVAGCAPGNTISFTLKTSPTGSPVDSISVIANDSGNASGIFGGLASGTYYLSASQFGLGTTNYCTNLPVQVSSGPSVGVYSCGDDVSSEDDVCPSECPNSLKTSAPGSGSTGRWCACGTSGKGCCRTGNACQNDQMICTAGICRTIPSVGTVAQISEGCDTTSVNTAIGCIPFGSSSALVTFFVSWGLGISGGVAMLSLIYSAFMIMTSAGDPKKLSMGQEYLVSSLSGIVLIAFSVFILRLIGIDILGLFV